MPSLFSFRCRVLTVAAAVFCIAHFPALAQSTNAPGTAPAQVTPGHTDTITPTKVVPTPATAPQTTIIKTALNSDTRKTLQDAMNSTTPATTNTAAAPAPPAK